MRLFNQEKELVSAFASKSKLFLSKFLDKSVSRHFLIQEFDSYFGVADIVLGTYRPYLSKRSQRRTINLNWLAPLLSFTKNHNFTLSDFSCAYDLSRKTALARIKEYKNAGFIINTGAYRYRVVNEYQPITDAVISIEAKLKNWDRALQQARRYQKFSDFSFVLLDGDRAAPALRNLHAFKQWNIGLITMKHNIFSLHTRPKRRERKKNEYFARINEAAYEHFIK